VTLHNQSMVTAVCCALIFTDVSAWGADVVHSLTKPATDVLVQSSVDGSQSVGFDAEERGDNTRHAWGQSFTAAANWQLQAVTIQNSTATPGDSDATLKLAIFEFNQVAFEAEAWGTYSAPFSGSATTVLYEGEFNLTTTAQNGHWLTFNLPAPVQLSSGTSYGFAIWYANPPSGSVATFYYSSTDSDPDGVRLRIRGDTGNTLPGGDLNFVLQGSITIESALGDCDDDGFIRIEDDGLAALECLTGVDIAPSCDCRDMDIDSDYDINDFAQIQAAAIDAPRPNIIYILADDMGWSDTGFVGSPISTPNLDDLRNQGIYLNRNYAQPQCTPSRVAFLSGHYPYRYGMHEHIVVPWSRNGLPGEVKTIAEKLKEANYYTSIIGKWHVGMRRQSFLPNHQGFDHSFVCIGGAISYWNYTEYDFSDIMRNGDKFYAASMHDNEASGNTYVTDLFKQEAIDVINAHDTQQPLFMYLSFTAPHHPLHAPASILANYDSADVEAYWADPGAERNRTASKRVAYMAMVDAMDRAIGEIKSTLAQKGMLDNTLIIFSSDNGGIPEADNRPLRSVKGDSFEGGVRVPGVAFWPGKIDAGSTSSEIVYIADWYATFAKLAGLDTAAEQLDGIDAWDALRGKTGQRQSLPMISSGRHAYITPSWSLVGGGTDYQLLLANAFSNFSLFNLDSDISQSSVVSNPTQSDSMKLALEPHFNQINRGYFNWDTKYSRYLLDERTGDHNLDWIINDQPTVSVDSNEPNVSVTIAPVSDELFYRLQGQINGGEWFDIDTYVCRSDSAQYTFPPFLPPAGTEAYRVVVDYHLGFPAIESFSLGDYNTGALHSTNSATIEAKLLPQIDCFLPLADIKGGQQVEIIPQSLPYPGNPQIGGALQLDITGSLIDAYLTRYFLIPYSRGRLYASMLLQFNSAGPNCSGEINWLRQNGGDTTSFAKLAVKSTGIYLDHTDSVDNYPETQIAGYSGEVVKVVFEFVLGTTGGDILNIYLDPDPNSAPVTPVASMNGEFTFDRLQTRILGSDDGQLIVDDIQVGREFPGVTTSCDDVPAPAAPTGLSAIAGDGSVSLNWDDNTEFCLSNYCVYRAHTSGGPYNLIAESAASDYVDPNVTNGLTYFYVVTAEDAAMQESPYSNQATATPEAILIVAQVEAEDGLLNRASILSAGSGWSGTGYVDLGIGGFVEWTINVPTAGNYDLRFLVAGDATGMTASISVNGSVVNSSLACPDTGSWNSNWLTVNQSTVALNAGNNTIRFADGGTVQPNIDQLLVINP
jgi:arylsulfatase A-like enzyme